MGDEQTVELPTIQAVNPGSVPGASRAEFGATGPLEPEAAKELAALEAQINNQLTAADPVTTENQTTIEQAIESAPVPQAVVPTTAPEVAPVQQGVPLPQGVAVPEKFKNPDGTLNEARLEKSLASLETYMTLERAMHQKRAQESVQPMQMQPPVYQQPQQTMAQYQPQPEPFEARVNRDIQSDPGTTVVNLMRAAVSQAEQNTVAQTTELRRKLELMEIGQRDPGVFTTQGAQALSKTLEDNPWLWNSPTPWTNAYKLHGPINAKNEQAPTAVPAAKAQVRHTAPILPGGASTPSIPVNQGPDLNSEAGLRRYLSERLPNNPQAQADYLEKVMMALQKQRRG